MDHIRKVVVTKISISLGERIAKSQHKRYYFLLNKTVKILFLIIFLMKQLHLMIEILRGLTNSIETTSLSGRSTTLE